MTTCFRAVLNNIDEVSLDGEECVTKSEPEIREPLPKPEHVVLHLRDIKGSLSDLHRFVVAMQRQQDI